MEKGKVYLFLGNQSEDIIIYLSAIIQNVGCGVLVVDDTKNSAIMDCIPSPLDQPEPIHYRGIDYIKIQSPLLLKNEELMSEDIINYKIQKEQSYGSNMTLIPEKYEEPNYVPRECYVMEESWKENRIEELFSLYHIVLVVSESYNHISLFQNVIHTYLISNLEKKNIMNLSKYCLKEDIPTTIILKDVCDGILNIDSYLKNYLIFDQNIDNRYEIPLDEVDYEYRICLGYKQFQGFRHLSKDYQKILLEMSSFLLQVEEQSIKKAFLRAKKGGIYEGSILE